MINRFSALPIAKKMQIAAIAGILLLCAINIVIFQLLRARSEAAGTQSPPIQFEYCEAVPEELCVLSFGRDGFGNAIINFFVPDKKIPAFYLIVKKTGTESRYECKQNSEIKTSVYCSGGALSLKQTIEVNILANEDDRLLGTGKFFIEAFLVSAQGTQNTPEANTLVISSATSDPLTPPSTTIATPLLETPTTEVTIDPYPNPTVYP